MKHQGGGGNWGIEVTSVRYDQFIDPTIAPNPCFASPGCRRESAPSACSLASTADASNQGIDVNITQNSPGAQYYLVYINPNGCDGNANNFSFVGRYLAPGWTDGGGPPATATGVPGWTGTLKNGASGWNCPVAGVTICAIAYNSLTPDQPLLRPDPLGSCASRLTTRPRRSVSPAARRPRLCRRTTPRMALQYPPYTGGDVANENYCVVSPNPGNPSAPCTTAKVTPGAVQFYFPRRLTAWTRTATATTHVFSGEQYNWIVIYQAPGNTCSLSEAERQRVDAVHRHHLLADGELGHPRLGHVAAGRPGDLLHGEGHRQRATSASTSTRTTRRRLRRRG